MKFWKSFEKRTRRVKSRNLALSILGSFIVFIVLGSMYSLQLLKFGYPMLFLAVILIGKYQYENCMYWYRNKKLNYYKHWLGFLGTALVMLVLGIQSPNITFKIVILIVGVLLIIPAALNFVSNRK